MLDGSLGSAEILATSGDIQVPARLGRIAGGNLFHSFQRFDVPTAGAVTLRAPAEIQHILVRVTGNTPSVIGGRLATRVDDSTAPHPADLLVVNPNGIVFNSGSTLDLGGSLIISTASAVRFADGTSFESRGASAGPPPVLTTSPPAAFAFLPAAGPGAGDVRIEGASLAPASGKGLAIAAGAVRVVGGRLFAPDGALSVVAVGTGTTGEVAISTVDTGAGQHSAVVERPSTANTGDVELSDDTRLNVDGVAGGRVVITARDLNVTDASISAQNLGQGDTGGVLLQLDGTLRLANGTIDASAFDAGRGGDITVRAREVLVDGSASPGATAILAEPGRTASAGGNVILDADRVTIRGGAMVSTTTAGAADAGSITVIGRDSVVLDGTGDGRVATGLFSSTFESAAGAGGDIRVEAGRLEILNAAVVAATSFGTGDGGDVTINARDVLIDGRGSTSFTGVSSGSFGGEFEPDAPPGTFGAAGLLEVTTARDLVLRRRASLASAAFFADARDLTARAGRDVVIRGRSRITAQSGGDGGNVNLAAGRRLAADRSVISAEAFDESAGAGGNINFDPRAAALRGTRVTANAVAQNAGNIRTSTEAFVVSPDSVITATSQNGAAGAIDVPEVDIAGALVQLTAATAGEDVRLLDRCAVGLADPAASSFVFTGRGGIPFAPGGFLPALDPVPVAREDSGKRQR